MFKTRLPSRSAFALTAAAAVLFSTTVAHAEQRHMVKVPASTLAELQSTAIDVAPSSVAFPGACI